MLATVRRHAPSVAVAMTTGILVALVVQGVGWGLAFFEEREERNEIRTFLQSMENEVFDDVLLQRGVEGFKNAGMDPAPNRDAVQLTIFSSRLEDFELLISVDATHISQDDRYKIRHQVAQARKRADLLIYSGRSWPVESWYREFFEDVRKQTEWLKQP